MTATLIIIAGVLLIAYAVYGTVQKARGKAKSSCCGSAESVLTKRVEDTDESHYPFRYHVSIDGMKCSNCAVNVENAINASGDTWAHVNLGRHRAEVLSKKEKTEEDFIIALNGTGYKVTGFEPVGK
ncbi:MAG: cation transporter [Mogibacterium sp.]|nr:cation transporter [Mogibacterium sp.]